MEKSLEIGTEEFGFELVIHLHSSCSLSKLSEIRQATSKSQGENGVWFYFGYHSLIDFTLLEESYGN